MSRRSKVLAYLLLSWPPHALAYAVAPVAVSRLGGRHGWHGGRPGTINLLGAAPIAAGVGVIAWAIVGHYKASPARVVVSEPTYLARGGAYRVSRNPLYLGGQLMWFGWSVLFGSFPVAACGIALVAGQRLFAVPFEERRLAAKFRADYDQYRASVPRWFGLPRTTSGNVPARPR